MGKIKKILESELVGGTQVADVYPVTSVKAVYDEKNERLDNILNRRGVVNISTNYSEDHTATVLTLEQAIDKVPQNDRVLGFQGKFLTEDGWETYTFTGDSVAKWTDIKNWDSFAKQSYVNKIEPIILVDFTTAGTETGYVKVSRAGEYYYQSKVKKVYKVISFTSSTKYTTKVMEPTIGQLYIYNGVIYSWNGEDMIVNGSTFTNIAWPNFNKTIELKEYLVDGYYSNNGILGHGDGHNSLDDRKACLLRISPYTKFKITFDGSKYQAYVKYHKGIDLANGLEYVSADFYATSNTEYIAPAVNYMSIAFINADKDWSTLEPVIEITVPEQVLSDDLKEQSQKIKEINTNLDSYKGSLKDMFTTDSYTILVGEKNANKGYFDNSGNFKYDTKSLSYIIDKPKFVTIENYTELQYTVKLFNISDGVLTLKKQYNNDAELFYHNLKEYDIAAVMFYNNIDSHTDISKVIKITNSPYPPKYDLTKILFSTMGENPGHLTIGTGYGAPSGGEVHHTEIGSNNKRACTLVPMLPGKLVLSNNIKTMNVYEVISITENKTDDYSYKYCLYKYNVSSSSALKTLYDADTNQTTFIFESSRPLLVSFANANNTNEDVDFKIISYTLSSYIGDGTYNIPISVNEFGDNTGEYDSFAEPVMVTAPNGTIMIGGRCGKKGNAYQDTFNSYSSDKGKTWTSKWTNGHTYLTYDRVNDKLYSLDGTSLYVSNDYGMTWTLKKTVSFDKSADMIEKYNSLREAEKNHAATHVQAQRYAYSHSITSSPNPGVQLSNGVICFQKRELITKYKASKDEESHWIVDSNGYPTVKDTSFANTVDIVESVAFIIYSKDDGETWEKSPHTPLGVMMDELTIAEAKQNQICINGRGGTEAAWNAKKVYRHIFFQVTPVDDKESFSIDDWEADYETTITNTIEDSIVNAGFAKIEKFKISGATKEIPPFWLFCNIYNPDGHEKHSQLLRVSPDCHNWFKVKLLTSNEEIIGGYSSIASTSDGIYIIMEGNRAGEPMKFINLTTEYLTDILGVLSSVKEYYN